MIPANVVELPIAKPGAHIVLVVDAKERIDRDVFACAISIATNALERGLTIPEANEILERVLPDLCGIQARAHREIDRLAAPRE